MPTPKKNPAKAQAQATTTPKPPKPGTAQPKKTKGGQGPKNPADNLIQLGPEEQKFQDALRECAPQERKFVLALLEGHNHTQAAIKAGYAPGSAHVQGTRLIKRAKVKAALEAGYEAAGISPARTLAFIAALANFDRSQIETIVRQRTVDHEYRRADAVVAMVQREVDVTRSMLDDLKLDEADESELKPLQLRLSKARLRLLDLNLLLDSDPDAMTVVEVERLEEIPLIDLKKARELGLSRFVKGVKRGKYGYEVELHSFMDGVDRAAKVHGLYRETLSISNPDGTPLDAVRNSGPEDLGKMLAAYDEMRTAARRS
ncbi:terminase small subunit [Deinococcus sp. 12RED42]|uniref:terminase small subunit n=1 Tax=Deinococcus sp. 12RED42 TaxID=2745872 RepID=UPI001E46ED4F|nr:terminase small subunit [Deinococcus sp. 12RED42]MCD0165417.1 terminase small subunit [Deinococcus sp. 12RED42]